MRKTTKTAWMAPCLAALLCAFLGACDDPTGVPHDDDRSAIQDPDPSAPSSPAEGELLLRIGQEARVPGTIVRVAFLAVRDDSRCPIDVTCVWAGDAHVVLALALGTGPSSDHVLHWNPEAGPGSVTLGTYRVSLVSLDPLPRAGEPLPTDAYRVRVKVERS